MLRDLAQKRPSRSVTDLADFIKRFTQILDTVLAIDVWLTSAEDSFISKLEWARLSGASERQLRDVRGIQDRVANLDINYVEQWVSRLALSDLWREVSTDKA